MKRLIIKALFFSFFFISFFILVNFLFVKLLKYTDLDFIKIHESLNFKSPDFDLLIFGTSFAEYGIDAELLTSHGIKSYNLSISGNTAKTSYLQLNDYMARYSKRPLYIILAINSLKELEESEIIQPVFEVTMKDFNYSFTDAPIFKFGYLGTEFIKKLLSSKHRKARLSYGQIKFAKSNPDDTVIDKLFLNIQEIESNHGIGKIAELCRKNDIQMIIIDMPGFKEVQNLSETGPYILQFPNSSYATLYNFRSHNFCKIFDSNKDWIGESHLNEYGAAKFTKELVKFFE